MSNWKRPIRKEDLPTDLPFSTDVSILNTPLFLNHTMLPNRICYQPMEGCDGTQEGTPAELTVRRYMRFAKGGAGLIWFEATAVVSEGRANPRQLQITEKNADDFARLVENIKAACLKENGFEPIVICQLTHSGRYSKPHGTSAPLIAYNKPVYEKDSPLPAECIVSDEYLDSLPEKYAQAAVLCSHVGFDGVDIKACHGYLFSEFLNAYLRPGRYGGDFEGRTRLILSAVKAVSAVTGQKFVLASRFNAYDGYSYPYGFGDSGVPGVPDFTEAVQLSQALYREGVSLLNVTMGNPYTNHEVNRPTTLAQEHAPYTSIKRMLDGAYAIQQANPQALVVASGLTYLGALAPYVASACISNRFFTVAGFGRQNFAYPDLAKDILNAGGMREDKLCLTCGKCTELMRAGGTPGCVIYDSLYTDLYRELKKR